LFRNSELRNLSLSESFLPLQAKECPKIIGKMDFGSYRSTLRFVMFRSPEFLLGYVNLLVCLGIQNSETLGKTDFVE